MTRTMALFAALALALGMMLLLALAVSAEAQPVEIMPLPPVTQTDGRAGACYSFYRDPQTDSGRPYLTMTVDAGSRWDRFDFSWPNLEPVTDTWLLGAYDSLVGDLHAAGMNVVGILLWTPGWATTGQAQGVGVSAALDRRPFGWYAPVPGRLLAPQAVTAASSPPRGLYEEWNDWTTADGDPMNYWGRFVYTVTSRYGDRVKHWEMWNEAEWAYFWSGSDADYAQLLKVGYRATKAACPDCTVLFAGLHYWADPAFFERVLDILNDDPAAPDNNYFFDVMSVHLYSRSSDTYAVINAIRNRMRLYVPDHPIWLTETGVPVWGDPLAYNPKYDYAATQDEAAAYVIQSYANAWASGVARYLFFRAHDDWCDRNQDGDCSDPDEQWSMHEAFGLIRNDRSIRPAYVAYQVAATYLVSPTFTTRVATGDGVRVTLWGTPRGKVSVLWNPGPTPTVYTLPAARPTATLVYTSGVTQTLTAVDNAYTLISSAASRES